ncbi:MAG: glutathione-disulfide reductase [Amylibacter sp.]|nr:glutathione-disulfide reductase [Amylibacter sp.]
MSFDYDLFVIGGGSGGVRAGRLAAGTGAKVGLAEEYRMGGTCVIRGCVPKKLMVYASSYAEAFEDAKGYGWSVGEVSFDWGKFIAAKDIEIDRLEQIYGKNLMAAGADMFLARAEVVDAHTVKLSTGEVFTTKHILVATGGTPFVPKFEGHEYVITSNEVFHLEQQPKRFLVVGGGYIACEFACIMNGLESKVTQYYRGEQVLRGFDHEVQGFVAEEMRVKGVDLHVGTDVQSIVKTDEGLVVTNTHGVQIVVDQVMYATGRVPNTQGLGLENANVALGGKGQIIVDGYSQTNVPSIYAVGDVTDRVNLTPVAIVEGGAFVDTVFHGIPTQPDHELIATAVFTQPEIGTVGMGEEEARGREEIEVYRAAFRPMAHILAGKPERMLMKLIVSCATRKVLGCHIVGHAAAEMIQLAAVALKMGATKEDFDRTMAIHPTAAEELVTMNTPVGG